MKRRLVTISEPSWTRTESTSGPLLPLLQVCAHIVNKHRQIPPRKRGMEKPKIPSEREAKGIPSQALDRFHMR